MQTPAMALPNRWERIKTRLFALAFSKLTSKHGKRVLYITSLYCYIVRFEKLKKEAILKLNRVMQVAHRDKAMELPMVMRQYVWNGTTIDTLLKENLADNILDLAEVRQLSERVVDMAPAWLHYAPRDKMISETSELLSNSALLAEAA